LTRPTEPWVAAKGDAKPVPAPAPETAAPAGHAQLDLASGFVPRPRLTDRIGGAPGARLVLLHAPAGYSKTTTLEEWEAEDDRPFAWVAASRRHDDPAVLLFAIADALDEIERVDPEVLAPLATPRPEISSIVLPRLGRSIHSRKQPFVLVIDDVHALTSPETLEVLATIIDSLPSGSQVAVASRTEPELHLGRMRANRQLVELTATQLAMTREESGALLRDLGLALDDSQLDPIFDRTEGWPAALYLAGFALSSQVDLGAAVESFAGDDRIVVDYLRDEFLSASDPDTVGFLTRSSILDELSGPVCDVLLDRTGSAEILEELARSNSLVVPLDRRGSRYRYHHLFAEMLRSELRRHEPDAEAALHSRASRWYADNSDLDRAIEHAIAADEVESAGELIWQAFPEVSGRGRIATLEEWLDRLGDERISSSPRLALTSAHLHINLGDRARTAHWTRIAAATAESSPKGLEPVEADVCLLEAILGAAGVVQMGKDASRASELHRPDVPWQAPCFLFRGIASHLAGHPERARPLLREAAHRGALVSPVVQTLALSQLALLALDDGDSEAAQRLVSQAEGQVARCGLAEYGSMALVHAVSALCFARSGRMERSERNARDAERLLMRGDMPPWFEAEARIALAGTCIRLDDHHHGRSLLDGAEAFLEVTPDAAILAAWLNDTGAALRAAARGGGRDWSLTTAELRTLQYLPSHLSFREIGERIHVSPNTVKTQARAVYRKLDVSSRAEAVEKARIADLLGEDPLREIE
jgi:LuxR family transcriptional regulator, maltose regulon positive regulatory protein